MKTSLLPRLLRAALLCAAALLLNVPTEAQILFEKGQETTIYLSPEEEPVAHTALEILGKDVATVFDGARLAQASEPADDVQIVAGTADNAAFRRYAEQQGADLSGLAGEWEAFRISRPGKKQLFVAGSDARGLAYGLLELSRAIGVSPWEWWADVRPEGRERFRVKDVAESRQAPSVRYRGIFLNDEDWGLTPWSTHRFEPQAQARPGIDTRRFQGQVGPQTYARIFELLLRLRANTLWPAMHEVTVPFYLVEGNRQMAERYGIVLSTSHCEPLMRNSATEWDLTGEGDYNFLTNRPAVIRYWADRLAELGRSENIFTMGMRGKHDGRMIGVKNTEEYKEALAEVLRVQDSLLRRYINPDSRAVAQQFVPYKEVLDVYRAGLQVPEHITLVWPDDNFGYIRHFPDSAERARSGGHGVYYHTSYWGEPHDFLWLGIVQPALMYQQMRLAYERGIRQIWILNVGDIKPSEYLTELFLDLAWNVSLPGCEEGSGVVRSHLGRWLEQTFGSEAGRQLLPLMEEFYRLSHVRKPEFMGNTRVYDGRHARIADLPWTESYIRERLAAFRTLSEEVGKIAPRVPQNRREAYFEMIQYPVQASDAMNRKLLYAQLARHSAPADSAGLWQQSDAAYDRIVSLTREYNSLLGGKWDGIMSFHPRDLEVFRRVEHRVASAPVSAPACRQLREASDYARLTGSASRIDGLGHGGRALCLAKGSTAEYTFDTPAGDSLTIDVCLVPTHAVEGGRLRFRIDTEGSEPQTFDCETREYSEEWKTGILQAQTVKTVRLPRTGKATRVRITTLDEGIVLDQLKLR